MGGLTSAGSGGGGWGRCKGWALMTLTFPLSPAAWTDQELKVLSKPVLLIRNFQNYFSAATLGFMYCTKYCCMPFWMLFYSRIRPLFEALIKTIVRHMLQYSRML